MKNEIWKDVNFEHWGEHYQVSNLGDVRSKDRINYAFHHKSNKYTYFKKRGKILIPYKNLSSYLSVKLSVENVKKTLTIHRLVAMTFIGLPNDEKNQVNHIDGNKYNNHIDNLEWCTSKENMHHARETKLLVPKRLGESPFAKKVAQINIKTNEIIKVWDCIKSARIEVAKNGPLICSACKGKIETAYGFKWKYI
jgi:hypothetical protein